MCAALREFFPSSGNCQESATFLLWIGKCNVRWHSLRKHGLTRKCRHGTAAMSLFTENRECSPEMAEAMSNDSKHDSDWDPKAGLSSPTLPDKFCFSRTSSTGSIDNILTSSSAHNTDDEDSDHKSTISYKERRREAHTQAEQKRRDAIKKGYDDLQMLVPTCQQDSTNSFKMSKATVLQKSIDYITFLLQQKKKHEEELTALRKEVVALQIMKVNYEQIVKVHQSQPGQNNNHISDEVKFQVFQAIGDSLFQTFNSSISVSNFTELSACVFSWLEEYCKPQTLKDVVVQILSQLNQTMGSQHS